MIFGYVLVAIFSLAICFGAGRLGRAMGVVDFPDGERKIHARATPLVGGFAILVPFMAMAVLLGIVTAYTPLYLAIAASVLTLLMLGYFDDRTHLPAVVRLLVSAAAMVSVLAVVPGFEVAFLRFTFMETPILFDGYGGLTATVFTVLCLVGFQNAVNMADGKNGLVIGMALVWVLALMTYAPAHMMPLLIAFAIALVVTLAFNLRGRLFLGDSGTYALSVAVGLTAIYIHSVSFVTFSSDAVAVLFLIPVLDVLRLMVSRVLKGQSPLQSARDHLHHILLVLMPLPSALAVYLTLVTAPIVLTILLPDLTLLWGVGATVFYAVIVAAKYRLGARVEMARQ